LEGLLTGCDRKRDIESSFEGENVFWYRSVHERSAWNEGNNAKKPIRIAEAIRKNRLPFYQSDNVSGDERGIQIDQLQLTVAVSFDFSSAAEKCCLGCSYQWIIGFPDERHSEWED
jgi:hypothetical protein